MNGGIKIEFRVIQEDEETNNLIVCLINVKMLPVGSFLWKGNIFPAVINFITDIFKIDRNYNGTERKNGLEIFSFPKYIFGHFFSIDISEVKLGFNPRIGYTNNKFGMLLVWTMLREIKVTEILEVETKKFWSWKLLFR